MRFVDAHLHTDMIEDIQLQKLVMMGMEAAVIPSPHMFLGSHDADAVLLLWERFLTLEVNTAKTLGFEAYASLSVPFFGVTAKDAEKCLEKLPDFLKHERGWWRWARLAWTAGRSSRSISSASTCASPRLTICP